MTFLKEAVKQQGKHEGPVGGKFNGLKRFQHVPQWDGLNTVSTLIA